MLKFKLTILAIIILVICSCKIMNQDKFAEREELEVRAKIEEILTKLGYNDFNIFIHYHKSFNNREISKSISTLKIFGDEIPIDVIYTLNRINYENQREINNSEIINNGYIENKQLIVNYDEEMESKKIFYEYISIVIIIDNIEQKESNELLKLFSNYILNSNRGDTIYIRSK